MRVADIGCTCLIIGCVFALAGVVQWKLGWVFMMLGRAYRDTEPAEFYLVVTFYFLLGAGIAAYGVGLVLGWWVPN